MFSLLIVRFCFWIGNWDAVFVIFNLNVNRLTWTCSSCGTIFWHQTDKKWFLWWNLDQRTPKCNLNKKTFRNEIIALPKWNVEKFHIFTVNQVEIAQVDNFTFLFESFLFLRVCFKKNSIYFDNISLGEVIIEIDFP